MLITNLFEADPIDFNAAKRKRDQAKGTGDATIPDNLRYAAAVNQQSKAPPATLSDIARDVILRNLDKVFSQQPLPDEDRKTLNAVIKANDALRTLHRQELVKTVMKLYQKEHGVKTHLAYPNGREAYLRDQPDRAKWRLIVGDQVHVFDHEVQAQSYVLTNLLRDGQDWSDDDKDALRQQIENLPEPEAPYDPMAREVGWDNKPREHEMLAHVEKILQPYSDYHNPVWLAFKYLDYRTGEYGAPTLTFHNRTSPERRMTFATLPDLEQWVVAHQAGIAAWYKRQQTVEHSDLARIRFSERKMLAMLRQILAGTADPDRTRDEAYVLIDYVIADIKQHPEVKDVLSHFASDLASQRGWKFLQDYHLEWLPERIQELLTKSV